MLYDLICLLSSWWFTVLASLFVAVFMALLWVRKSRQASAAAGVIAFMVVFGILGTANVLLNLPLGPSLPGAQVQVQALPSDYTGFWMVVGSVFALVGFAIMVLLWRILQTLAEIVYLLRGQP